jgi:outer membrane protein TolC
VILNRLIVIVFIFGFSVLGSADTRISLEQFLAQVKSQNLSLKLAKASVEAAESNSVGITLPAPMIGFNQMKDESGTGPGYEINQTIPFPTKMTNDHSARKFDSEAEQMQNRIAIKETLADAKFLYFSLWQSQERLVLLREKKDALQTHIKLATAGARSDSFLKIHILKTESDLDLLENEILIEEQNHREKQIQLAQMINQSAGDFLPIAEELKLSDFPKQGTPKSPFQIEFQKLRLESLQSRESEAKAGWLPDFNIRYKEMSGTPMQPRYSELMLGVTLPFVFFWQPNATSTQASVNRIQGELKLNLEQRKIELRQETLLVKARALQKQLNLFSEKLLPRAEKRMHLVHNLAPRDMETLQDHRETLEAFPELKMKALELRGQYEEAVTELQKYSSEEL